MGPNDSKRSGKMAWGHLKRFGFDYIYERCIKKALVLMHHEISLGMMDELKTITCQNEKYGEETNRRKYLGRAA